MITSAQTAVRISVIIFAMMLAAPALWGVLGIYSGPGESEKRRAAVWPDPPQRLEEVPRFTRLIDRYANDHFGLRNMLVRVSTSFNKALGRSDFSTVIIGKGDWLFFAGNNAVEIARGRSTFLPVELERLAGSYAKLNQKLEAAGINFAVVIVPGKASMYPEHLPWWAREPEGVSRNTDLLQAQLENLGVRFLDLTGMLLQLKANSAALYQRGDSHWHDKTAYLVYTWICELLGVPALGEHRFVITPATKMGDLQKILNLPESQAMEEWTLKKPRAGKTVVLEDEPRRWARTRINTNARAPEAMTVLLLRDSFGNKVYPLLEATFQKTITTHYRAGKFPWALVNEHQPDWVIYMSVERFVNPDLMAIWPKNGS